MLADAYKTHDLNHSTVPEGAGSLNWQRLSSRAASPVIVLQSVVLQRTSSRSSPVRW